jgi:hypothetical protein
MTFGTRLPYKYIASRSICIRCSNAKPRRWAKSACWHVKRHVVSYRSQTCSRLKSSPPSFPHPVVPRRLHRETPQTPPSLILNHLSRPRLAALHLAVRCCGALLSRLGTSTLAAHERRQPTEALVGPRGVLRGCTPEGPALKCHVNVLFPRSPPQALPRHSAYSSATVPKYACRISGLCNSSWAVPASTTSPIWST